jgi:hypothetical protein
MWLLRSALNDSIKALKRFLAILLLTIFGLPLVSPLFAMSRSSAEGVRACCRRDGKHHCMGETASVGDTTSTTNTRFSKPAEQCPYSAEALIAVHQDISTSPTSRTIFVSLLSHPCGLTQTESKRRISRDRSRQKRGPPAATRA